MDVADLLGRSARLEILRVAGPGAFLALSKEERGEKAATVLLPGTELPDGAAAGDQLDVFLYLDSEGRPIATLRTPKLELGQVAFLRVTACTSFGAFVDWGPQKELLVPHAQQTRPLKPGDVQPIGLYRDGSGRFAGTMRVTEMLAPRATELELDEWVDGEAWRSDPAIGLFVIVERRCVGLVPKHEPHSLSRGQAARFRVSNLFEDGKLELSLRGHALDEMASDAQRVLDRLLEPRPPRVGDSSSPEEIRRLFGLSKKAFKRAVGYLLKQGRIRLDDSAARHCVALPPSGSQPRPRGNALGLNSSSEQRLRSRKRATAWG
jgi:predicted RNA-binding protein (virulence factor B family)